MIFIIVLSYSSINITPPRSLPCYRSRMCCPTRSNRNLTRPTLSPNCSLFAILFHLWTLRLRRRGLGLGCSRWRCQCHRTEGCSLRFQLRLGRVEDCWGHCCNLPPVWNWRSWVEKVLHFSSISLPFLRLLIGKDNSAQWWCRWAACRWMLLPDILRCSQKLGHCLHNQRSAALRARRRNCIFWWRSWLRRRRPSWRRSTRRRGLDTWSSLCRRTNL